MGRPRGRVAMAVAVNAAGPTGSAFAVDGGATTESAIVADDGRWAVGTGAVG
ncbi:hypothetical protein [Streptomyces sp. CB01881]|uniref:hypothetical protein n=1 Tax=Streptomyces sp. CB01881 TaxID=2078691 RepID=UPI00129C3920|nr:hypothetical protein [Streptomyces sp. CB01881]